MKPAVVFIVTIAFLKITNCQDYCAVNHTSGCSFDFINGVVLNTLSNNSTGCSGSTYTLYDNLTTELIVGNSYNLSITSGNFSSNYYYAWLDYNNDGDFDDANEYLGYVHSTATYQTNSIPFTVPSDNPFVKTRLRIRCAYGTFYNTPCGNYTYGETEDYEVSIHTFTESSQVFSGTYYPFSIIDSDSDGDMDVFLNDRIHVNNGSGSFTQIPTDISGQNTINQDWGDIDNDGDLDLLVAGIVSPGMTKLFENQGSNVFSEVAAGLTQVEQGNAKCVDLDNDGLKDIIVCGNDMLTNEVITKCYLNNGDLTFTEVETGIKNMGVNPSISIADYNTDGLMDILISGRTIDGNLYTTLYKNQGNLIFEELDTGLPIIYNGYFDWGDFDNDGDLDLLINGQKLIDNSFVLSIYENNGNDEFLEVNAGLQGMSRGCCRWGDYNNDGYLDIATVGRYFDEGWNRTALIYKNNGDGTFIEVENIVAGAAEEGYIDWADFDNDNDLDLMISGMGPGDIEFAKIFLNNRDLGNSIPSTPSVFTYSTRGNEVTIQWKKSNDSESGINGLNYNISIGSSSGQADLKRADARLSTGTQLLCRIGNCGKNNTFKFSGLDAGTYFYKVQAIDGVYKASAFSLEQSFQIKEIFSEGEIDINVTNLNPDNPYLKIADIDIDGDLDFSAGGFSSTILAQNDAGVFSTKINNLPVIKKCGFDWGDFDNDGDLDLLAMGEIEGAISSLVFINEGNWNFTEKDFGLQSLRFGNCHWADIDNDGDLDIILVGGRKNTLSVTGIWIYENNNDTSFNLSQSITDFDLGYPASVVGDLNSDGQIDLVVADSSASVIYYNNLGIFTACGAFIKNLSNGSADLGDIDHDGDLDLLICGFDEYRNNYTKIYRNDGMHSFSEMNFILRGISEGKAQWIDFDGDHDLDILLSGKSSVNIKKVYFYEGGDYIELNTNFFEPLSKGPYLTDVADLNNDRDPDFISSGLGTPTGEVVLKYTNNGNYSPTQLDSPTELSTQTEGYGIRLSWTPVNEKGVTYNVWVATKGSDFDIVSPMSDTATGFRYIPERGNASVNNFFILDSLPVNEYLWGVQAVSSGMIGGTWSSVDTFIINDVSPDFNYDTAVCYGTPTTFADTSVTTDTIIARKWFFGDGTTSTEQNPTNPIHLYQTADTFEVTLWAYTESGDSASRTHQVIVKPSPTAAFTVDPVCKGETSVMADQSDVSQVVVASWLWKYSNGDSSLYQGTVNEKFDETTSVTLTITANNGCSDTDMKIAEVVEYSQFNIDLANSSYNTQFCQNDSTILVAPYFVDCTYRWQKNNDNLGVSDTFLIIKDVASVNTYSLEIETNTANCISEESALITVSENPPTPQITIEEGYHNRLCKGDTCKLTTPVLSGYSYYWYKDSVIIGNAGAVFATDSGMYSITVVNNASLCKNIESDTIEIEIVGVPAVPQIVPGDDQVICLGDTITFSIYNDETLQYYWYRNGLHQAEFASNILKAGVSGEYFVVVVNSEDCSKPSQNAVNVTVFESPDKPTILIEGETEFCSDINETQLSSSGTAEVFHWIFNES
ncbi:MAG: VCBS repeat-containing protein, partial [Bacteroidales bacterium]|nr:VCBS repeat-containing protein [Bacteroidales bacterium]MBN2817953.1 VCBS repeat-containing protein [Bacteroidales bacterium]